MSADGVMEMKDVSSWRSVRIGCKLGQTPSNGRTSSFLNMVILPCCCSARRTDRRSANVMGGGETLTNIDVYVGRANGLAIAWVSKIFALSRLTD